MHGFIDGAIFIEFAVIGLFFLRSWRRTRDRFFLLFSLSFWTLAINRMVISALSSSRAADDEANVLVYVCRLAAFLLLLIAIIDKNMQASPGTAAPVQQP